MHKDNSLTAPKLRDLFWFFYDFLTSSSGCSIRVFVVYSFKQNVHASIPTDISSTRRKSTNENKKSALQYVSLWNSDES